MTQPNRSRDPEQKVRAIGHAAAELIAESGVGALTHRAVAARAGVAVGTTTLYFSTIGDLRKHALEYLAAQTDDDIHELAEGLSAAVDPADFLAEASALYLADLDMVLAECSLSYAGVFEADLRELSLRWSTGFTDALTPHFGTARSEILAMLLDGAFLNTALTGSPPTPGRLRAAIAAIAAMPDEDARS